MASSPFADERGPGPETGATTCRSHDRAAVASPFVWQHDLQVLLLDGSPDGWVAAELRFDPENCLYVEIRRATYRWSREAVGALLARVTQLDPTPRELLAINLSDWVMYQTGV